MWKIILWRSLWSALFMVVILSVVVRHDETMVARWSTASSSGPNDTITTAQTIHNGQSSRIMNGYGTGTAPNDESNLHTNPDDDNGNDHAEQISRRLQAPPTIGQMTTAFQLEKAKLLERLKTDYGAMYFDTLFMDSEILFVSNNATRRTTIGRNAFLKGSPSAQVSWEKTVRKMKLNILQHLIQGKVQDFVWATAGNDGAAGHGNFFDEQYTMILNERVKHMFTSVGLRFVPRPYAQGGATSAPEMAACAKEIFGTDVDMITWDFGMTDGRNHWRIEFFAHRVHILPNHPVLLVLNAGIDPDRIHLVEYLTNQGMSVLRQDEAYVMQRKLAMPDSKSASTTGLFSMTDHVRFFRCGYGIEQGGECTQHKFTQNGTCDERADRNHWHNGWKLHAYHGNLYALFLMEVIEDALYELKQEEGDWEALYSRLSEEELVEYQKFEKESELLFGHKWNVHDDVSAMELYRDPTYCHTANIPAQTRFLGHVLNTPRNDNIFKYVRGQTVKTLRYTPTPEMELCYFPLVGNERCNMTLHVDAKDFFIASGQFQDFQTITFPNDLEIAAYGSHTPRGIIAICAAACSWDCNGSKTLSPDAVHTGKAAIQVNGEDVDSVIPFENCFILAKETGQIHWEANEDGRYTLGVKVDSIFKFFRFSSFIIW